MSSLNLKETFAKKKTFWLIRWRPDPTKAPQSGWSIFYIEIPSGYRIEERFLKDLVGFGIVRNLRDAENYGNSLNFIFEFVSDQQILLILIDIFQFDDTPTCWQFEIKRYIPVANMTRYYEMTVYEWHEPCEIFAFHLFPMIFVLYSIGSANRSMYTLRTLFSLDICSVCGSYQCPYCPYYARSSRTALSLLIIILMFLCNQFYVS